MHGLIPTQQLEYRHKNTRYHTHNPTVDSGHMSTPSTMYRDIYLKCPPQYKLMSVFLLGGRDHLTLWLPSPQWAV